MEFPFLFCSGEKLYLLEGKGVRIQYIVRAMAWASRKNYSTIADKVKQTVISHYSEFRDLMLMPIVTKTIGHISSSLRALSLERTLLSPEIDINKVTEILSGQYFKVITTFQVPQLTSIQEHVFSPG